MQAVRILAGGATSPLGLTALQTAMCARARRLNPVETPFVDRRGRRAGACLSGVAGFEVTGYARLIELAASALRDAVRSDSGGGAQLPPRAGGPWPAIVALPDA